LLENTQYLKDKSIVAIKSLLQYIYTDTLDAKELTSVSLFELWKISQQLLLPRLEMITRSMIQKMINENTAVEFAACAFRFSLKNELSHCLQLIQQNPYAMREEAQKYPDLVLEFFTTPPTNFTVDDVIIPESTLISDLNSSINQHCDITLSVNDLFGISKTMMLHKAVICQSSRYFSALFRFNTSSNIEHKSPIPLEAFNVWVQSWYTGIVKATPIDCFYLVLASDFYNISENVINQCLEFKLQLNIFPKEVMDTVLNSELIGWLLASRYVKQLCDDKTICKMHKMEPTH